MEERIIPSSWRQKKKHRASANESRSKGRKGAELLPPPGRRRWMVSIGDDTHRQYEQREDDAEDDVDHQLGVVEHDGKTGLWAEPER